MAEISNKKFVSRRERHFDLAIKEQPCVKNDADMLINQQNEYMTGKDFWEEADKRIIKICKQYGVLQ